MKTIKVKSIETKPTNNGGVRFTIKDEDGATAGSFDKKFSDVSPGMTVDVEVEQNGTFTNYKLNNIHKGDTPVSEKIENVPTPSRLKESALLASVSVCEKLKDSSVSSDGVLAVAKKFYEWLSE